MLQYDNWTDNQVKTEYFSHPIGQKSILEIVKLAKMINFSVKSGSKSGSSFVGPIR